ncbi:hypothetical protein ACQEU8_33350 [Streptomyces sp. CA-250714]|uniref:hypothetical protein n=1 Tax=Streptomyces sp. CA-250714 TaxID=3240060 RepID=UPI003D8C7352
MKKGYSVTAIVSGLNKAGGATEVKVLADDEEDAKRQAKNKIQWGGSSRDREDRPRPRMTACPVVTPH